MNRTIAIFLLSVAISIDGGVLAVAGNGFDVLLKGGRVVDGTGAPWYVADIAVRDGKIVGDRPAGPPSRRARGGRDGVVRCTWLHRHDGPDRCTVPQEPSRRGQLADSGDHHHQCRRGPIRCAAGRQERGDRRLDDHDRILHRARKGRAAAQRRANGRAHPGAPDRPW